MGEVRKNETRNMGKIVISCVVVRWLMRYSFATLTFMALGCTDQRGMICFPDAGGVE